MAIPGHAGVHLLLMLALALSYATISIRPQPPGLTRLLMSLPVVLAFTLGPLQVEESVMATGSLGFLLAWLGNFKLLAFALNRGPLAHPGLNAAQWLLLLLLPYFPARRGYPRARASSVALSLLAKVGLAGGLTVFLLSPQGEAYPVLRHACYALYVWLFASLLLDAPMPLGCHLLNHMDLQPAMVNPFASASLREFWGRRYNCIVSCVLRDTVYLPLVEGCLLAAPKDLSKGTATQPLPSSGASRRVAEATNGHAAKHKGAAPAATAVAAVDGGADKGPRRRAASFASPFTTAVANAADALMEGGGGDEAEEAGTTARRMLGLMASFAVSGIMHEVCIAYMCGGQLEGSFRMLGFFVVQPPLILAQEAAYAALLPKRLQQRSSSSSNSSGARAIDATGKGGTARSSPRGGGGRLAEGVVRLLQTAVTLGLVLTAAEFLFWGPFEECGIDERGLREAMGAMRAVGGWVGRLGAR